MISRVPSSAIIRDLERSETHCSSEELQMPRWRVAGRRCSESSETQRRRAEPLVHSRKIRFSSSKLYPGKSMAVRLGGGRAVEGKIWLTTNSRFFAGRQIPTWRKLFVNM